MQLEVGFPSWKSTNYKRVHRFDEGVTWWRPDSVELKVLQVVEALA